MARRSSGKCVINFGMVSIPVKLYTSASTANKISFNNLDPKGRKLKQQYVDPDNNVIVADDMLKGFEYTKGKYVIFTKDELKAFAEVSDQCLSIEEFVPAMSVPATFIEKSYYLVPDVGGSRAYSLLSKALSESNRVGLARFTSRGKTNLVMVKPHEDGLSLCYLFYANEVTPFSEVKIAPEPIKDAELQLAKMLIEQISVPTFDPTKFIDEAQVRLKKVIEQKIHGQPVVIDNKKDDQQENVIDLMVALEQSLKSA